MEARARSDKYKFYTALTYLCVYLIIVSIPFSKFLNANFSALAVVILKLSLSVFMIINLSKDGYLIYPFKVKNFLLCLPLFILCGSNLFYVLFSNVPLSVDPNSVTLINSLISCLITALTEELIFRTMVMDILKDRFKPLLNILISAGIFGFVHFFAGVFSNPLSALLQAGYTFILGLVVGYIYLFGGSIYAAVALHFLFNFLNNSIYPMFFDGSWNTAFYIVNIVVGALVLLYGLGLYFLRFRKQQ